MWLLQEPRVGKVSHYVADRGRTQSLAIGAGAVRSSEIAKCLPRSKNVRKNSERCARVVHDAPQYGVQLQPIDFAMYARACGAPGYTLEDPQDAESVLQKAFAHDGPALVEAVVDPNEPPMPGNVTMSQAWNFAKSLVRGERERWEIIKTVLENKVREVV